MKVKISSMRISLLVLVTALVLPLAGLAAAELFIDVPAGAWFSQAVSSLREKNIFSGYPDGSFRPENNVNRAELALTLEKTISYMAKPEGTEPWRKFTNREFLYSIYYPPKWSAVPFFDHLAGFQPPTMSDNNVQWAVIVMDDDTPEKLESEIDKMGTEFGSTRFLERTSVTINGMEAIKVTARTSQNPLWEHVQIFVKSYGKIYIITNGAIANRDFDFFYGSFKILPLTKVREKKIEETNKQQVETGQPKPVETQN